MKTKEELENIKERLEKLSAELHELTDEELEQVTGGTTEAILARMEELKFEGGLERKAEDEIKAKAGIVTY